MSAHSEGLKRARRLRPLGVLEILDEAFELYRSNFVLFLGMSVALAIPREAVAAWLTKPSLTPLVGLIYAVALEPLYTGVMVLAASDLYIGTPSSIADYFRRTMSRSVLPRLWATCVVAYLVMQAPGALATLTHSAALDVLSIWFLIACLIFPLTGQACVMEGLGPWASLRRSAALMKGFKLKFIALGLAMGMVMLLGYLVFQLPVWVTRSLDPATPIGHFASSPAASKIATALVGVIVGPFFLLGLVIFYYDTRVRKEGYDIQLMAEELERMNDAGARREPHLAEENVEKSETD